MMRQLALMLTLALAACGGAQKAAGPSAKAGVEKSAGDRAIKRLVEGAELLARGGPKRLARAEAVLSEAVTLDPGLWEAHYDLGLARRRRGALDEARAALARAHELAPKEPEPLWALAECELARGELSKAAGLLEQLLEIAPDHVEAHLALSAIERQRGEIDAALAAARALLIQNPRETRALLEIGRIYRATKAYDVAELVLEKARALSSESAAVYNELGLLALDRGDTQLSFTHFEKAESLDARFLPAHLNKASVLLAAGDYVEAERAYRAAISATSDAEALADARVGLGIALRGQGKHKEARATYEKVLEAQPAHPAALFDLGVLFADFLDRRQEAIALFERYLKSASSSDSHRASAERYLQDIRMSAGERAP